MESSDSQEIVSQIRSLFGRYATHLSEDGRHEIEHYLAHDEYEMAFEGLALELLNVPPVSSEDRRACVELARRLGLDRESVFDPELWRKLGVFAAGGR